MSATFDRVDIVSKGKNMFVVIVDISQGDLDLVVGNGFGKVNRPINQSFLWRTKWLTYDAIPP